MLAAAAAVGALIGSVHHASMGVGRFEVAGLVLSYPKLNGAEWLLLGLAAVGATAITVAGPAAGRQRSAYPGFLDRLEALGRFAGPPAVKVIVGTVPEAF